MYAISSDNLTKAHNILLTQSLTDLEGVKLANKGIYQLLLWVKAVVALHFFLNPLNFVSVDYVKKKFVRSEIEVIEYIYHCLENWRFIYSIKLN